MSSSSLTPWLLLDLGKYKTALQELSEAVPAEKDMRLRKNLLADIHYLLQDEEDEIVYKTPEKTLIQLPRDSFKILAGKAEKLLTQGDEQKAAQILNIYAILSPQGFARLRRNKLLGDLIHRYTIKEFLKDPGP